MTRDDAKQLLPIIQAFADGKTVQYGSCHGLNTWVDATHPTFDTLGTQWRIKPEPREFFLALNEGNQSVKYGWPVEGHGGANMIKVREVLE